ncbi:MAG TPA: patatin-like phospholipase family protein [Pyrinomonadaceae bacterium]|nr:patatin-like phospholipase family protein [Pyrinomonadaceae bacterium]
MASESVPLHVFEVLEEEYVSLYGPIADGETLEVQLPAVAGASSAGGEGRKAVRTVEAARDWLFRAGHLRDARAFAEDLLSGGGDDEREFAGAQRRGDDWIRNNLRAYLRGRIGEEVLGDPLGAGPNGVSSTAGGAEAMGEGGAGGGGLTLEEALNRRVLDDPGLYSPERFSDLWIGKSALGLSEAGGAAGRLSGEALRQFNRVLLEDAFPAHVEPIHNVRLAAVYRRLHAVRPKALSLSGGGIRSGTFGLGLIQGLARHGLLERFDYLSTVSGGGYIGGWLTAWLHRHPEGVRGVTRELRNSDPASKIDPDPKPVQYLREYSNFLTPKAGFLTADTWAFVGIYLRNLLLNWLVLIPLLLGVLMLPRLLLTVTLNQPAGRPMTVARFLDEQNRQRREADETGGRQSRPALSPEAVEGLEKVPPEERFVYPVRAVYDEMPGVRAAGSAFAEDWDGGLHFRHFLFVAGFLLGVWALAYVGFNRPGVRELLRRRNRRWYDRADQHGFLRWCLLPLVASAALLTTYWAWRQETATLPKTPLLFLLFGLAFTFGGWLVASLVLRRGLRQTSKVEAFAVLLAGVAGGFLFWVISLLPIGHPVNGYGLVLREGQLVGRPLDWADWTSWTWTSWLAELYVCLGVPIFLLVFWTATTFFVGVTSYSARISDEDREWWARFGAWLLIAALAWVVLNALVIFGPLALLESPKLLGAVGGLSGLIAILVGRSARTPARAGGSGDDPQAKGGMVSNLISTALPALGLVFIGALIALLSLATTGLTRQVALQAGGDGGRAADWLTNIPATGEVLRAPGEESARLRTPDGFRDYAAYVAPVVPTLVKPAPTPVPGATPPCQPVCVAGSDEGGGGAVVADAYTGAKVVHMNVLHHTSWRLTALLILAAAGFGLFVSRFVNLNIFSLHGGYRNRLIRGFLGASRPGGERKPNPFTGFDPADNIHLHELRWALFDEGDFLRPAALAEALLEGDSALAEHLRERELLGAVGNAYKGVASPALVAALRSDLNAALEGERLYADGRFASVYARAEWFARLPDEVREALEKDGGEAGAGALKNLSLRSDYHLLLNRLAVEGAFPRMLKPGPPPPYKLMHVVNTSLNLVGGEKLAWQQRKAEPFSFSPLHSGCFRVGYRRSADYGGPGGVSLGTAVAISGAAASSNMGYYTTSPVISILLTLFNVRLGWWLGNPGPAGADTYMLRSPLYSISPVVYEAFGMTNDRYRYVYLTDGGHFENLAVYEMVLRRCHLIFVSDGAEDREYRFGDLGNAVRKIRIDLGVPVEFPYMPIYAEPPAGKGGGMYWAIGRVRYTCLDSGTDAAGRPVRDGLLLYVKPAVYGDEPRDVLEYKKSFPAFPHQSTGDQFFDEPQFESYRALGSFIMERMLGEHPDPDSPADLYAMVGKAYARLGAKLAADGKEPEDEFARWVADWLADRV